MRDIRVSRSALPILSGLLTLAATPVWAQAGAAPVVAPPVSLAVPAAASVPTPASAPAPAAGDAVTTLVRQAERWLALNRADLAASAIARALSAAPGNTDALLVAARIETTRGNRDAAVGYLRRADALAATTDQRSAIESALRGATLDPVALEEARRLARDGRADEAARRYRALFSNGGPSPDYAREYYQALAGSAATRNEGLSGLGRLAAAPNADPATLVAGAEALTYQESTRAEGITRLRALADRADTSSGAQRAWKQALGFLGQDPQAALQIAAYLQRFPNDPELTQRLASLRSTRPAAPGSPSTPGIAAAPDPGAALRRDGFALLDSGALPGSADKFIAALAANPSDSDALGGLGLVRLRQNRPADAAPLLERAITTDPAHASQWQKALDGAAYGAELTQARTLLGRGDAAGADTLLRQAVRRDVPDRTDAETLLGDVALRQGDAAAAEQHYRAALSRRPGFPPAVTGLNQAQRAQNRTPDRVETRTVDAGQPAQRPAPALPPVPAPAQASTSAPVGGGRAGELRAQAAQINDTAVSVSLLRAAVAEAPSDPWVRLDLARALKHQGRGSEGQALVEELAARDGTPDSHFAAALFAQEDNRLDAADRQLEAIPPLRRTPDMARLQVQLRISRDVARAAAALTAESGATGPARQQLMVIATRPDPSGGTGAAVIRAFGDVADRAAAVEASRVALAANPTAGTPARLAIAGALLAAGADAEANAMADQLGQSTLSADQRRDLAALRTGIAIRASDRLNEGGAQAQAFERLRAVLAQDPDNPDGQLALARLYQGARQPAEALRLAQNVLSRDPSNFAARQGAVEAALALGDQATARILATDTQTIGGTDSRMLYLQAKVANATGNTGKGQKLLEQSLAQRQAELGIDAGPAGGETAGAMPNPFQSKGQLAANPAGASRDPLSRQILRDLGVAAAANTPTLAFLPTIHTRSGSAGLDQLSEVSSPVQGVIPAPSLGGQFTATIQPEMVTSGQLGGNLASQYRFGMNALLGTSPIVPKAVTAYGAGFDVAYMMGDNLKVNAGTTPIGFKTANVVGGFDLSAALTDYLRVRVIGDRHAVTDSLLSWAGITDPVSRTTWGSVVSSGGRAQLETPIGAGSAYLSGGYAVLTGQNVVANNRVEAGAGLSYPLVKKAEGTLTAGLDLVYFAYANNQRAFTLGNGGYFSPQSFGAMNVPFDYRAKSGRLSYHLGGLIGYAAFHEGSSPVFPRNPSLQGQLAVAALTNPLLVTQNPALTRNGPVAGVRIDLDYELTDDLLLGAALRYDKAPQFDETNVMVRLKGRF